MSIDDVTPGEWDAAHAALQGADVVADIRERHYDDACWCEPDHLGPCAAARAADEIERWRRLHYGRQHDALDRMACCDALAARLDRAVAEIERRGMLAERWAAEHDRLAARLDRIQALLDVYADSGERVVRDSRLLAFELLEKCRNDF